MATASSSASAKPHRTRGFLRKVRHRARPYFSRPLASLLARVIPRIYVLYMRLVFATSRVEDRGFGRLHDIIDEYGGAVALLWHEELLTGIYGYPHMGFRPSTLASPGDLGEGITRILHLLCYDVVFRGSSSHRESRRNRSVLNRMIEHMRSGKNVLYGLTVDGSKGPAYRIKQGSVVIARECDKPLVLQRTWHRRCVRLNTWDRTAVPLPFNVITFDMKGPYILPDYAHTREGLQRFVVELENDLIDLAAESYDRFGQPRPRTLVRRHQET